jgi:predicted oxidoreductase (fatty acid repression mutant protein)
MFGSILKQMLPVLEKQLSDEKITEMVNAFVSRFPVSGNEKYNAVIVTVEKNGTAYLSVVGMAYTKTLEKFYVTETKEQMPLKTAIKNILEYAK